MRSEEERLLDILEAIANIRGRLPEAIEPFVQDDMMQVWVIHHLWVIGEAANALSAGVRERHPELPWADIIGMRHILIHQYFRRNLQTIWRTATTELPSLEQAVRGELDQMPDAT